MGKAKRKGLSIRKTTKGWDVIHSASGNRLMPFTYSKKAIAEDFMRRAEEVADWTVPWEELVPRADELAAAIRTGKPQMFEEAVGIPHVARMRERIADRQDARSARSKAADAAKLAQRVVRPSNVGLWLKHPERYDIRGVDTPSSRETKLKQPKRRRRLSPSMASIRTSR